MASELWQRQETDTDASFKAFNIYLRMSGKRSLSRLVELVGKKSGYSRVLERWSGENNWQARVQAYDAHLEAIDLADYEDKRLASRKTRQSIVQGLESFLGRMMEDSVDKNNNRLDLTISELQSIASAAKTIMTESRNEFNDLPTQRKELTGKNGSKLTFNLVYPESDDG